MNEKLKSLGIIILLVIILILLGFIAYLFFKRKHTRERFSFFSILTLSSIALSILLPILNGQSIWGIVIYAINELFSTSIPIKEPTIYEQLLSIVVFYLMTKTILDIHKNWNSDVKTEREYEKSKRNIKATILEDFYAQLKHYVSKDELLKIYKPEERKVQYNFLGEINYSTIPWNQNGAEILQLTSNQYNIDLEEDWYREQNCYISTFGKDELPICVFCSINEPQQKEIANLFKFLKRYKKNKIKNIIFLIENGNHPKTESTKDSFVITKRYKSELLSNLVDFSNYFRYINKRFESEEVSLGTKVTLNDIYVPSSGIAEDDETIIESVEAELIKWVKDESTNKHLAILGDYGQGKSVLALKLTYELIINKSDRIPILIELRGKSPRNLTPLEILATWTSNFRLDPLAVLKLHFEGKILLIFEGFDEMDLVGDAEMRLNHFRNLWDFAKTSKSKILISGRPNFFLDDIEQKEALGIYQPLSADVPHCEAIYLKNFSKEQIEDALRNSNKQTKEGILNIVSDSTKSEYSDRFYDLASRPSTLFLISSIWKEAKFSERKDKINSAVVIREFIQAAYERQGKKGNRTPLTVKEREYFMLGIAVGMMRLNGYSNQISKDKLNSLIIDLYNSFPDDFTGTNSAFEKARKPLKQRMKENEEIAKESILTDVRACGILVKDLSRNNHFKFAHKSFMEYLVSEFYIISLLKKEDTKTNMFYSIDKAIEDSTLVRDSKETTDFISQLLASEFFNEKDIKQDVLANEIIKVLHKSKYVSPNIMSFIISNYRPILYLTTIIMLLFMFTTLYFIGFGRAEEVLSLKDSKSPLFSIITLIFSLLMPLLTFFIMSFKRHHTELNSNNEYDTNIGFTSKVKIWYLTCKELGIDETNLCKVVYSKFLKKIEKEMNSAHNIALPQ